MNKILLVSHNLELEGATWSLFYLAKGFKDIGWKVSILSPQKGPLIYEYRKHDIDVIIEDFKKIDYFFKKDFQCFFVNTIIGFKFLEKLDQEEIKRTVWCIRESEREVYFKKYKDLRKEYFCQVKNVVFVSDVTRGIYEDLDVSKNFITIHNGLDLEKIYLFKRENLKNNLRKRYGFLENDYITSIIGTVCLRKGQVEFVEAAIDFLKSNNDNQMKFLVVGAGRGGSYEKRIKEIIKENYCEKNIFVIDETSDVFNYYYMSDLFVCNSYVESFPRVILEAMAFELPIISTNVYGIPEQIEDKKEGLLLVAGDVLDLKNKLDWMIKNKLKAKEMAINARKKIEEKFSFEIMINKYIDLIKKICVE